MVVVISVFIFFDGDGDSWVFLVFDASDFADLKMVVVGDDPFEVLGVERSWTKPEGYQNEWWTQVQIERDQEARHGLHDDMYERTD